MSLSKKQTKIRASEFDAKFDAGEDVTSYINLQSAKVHYPVQRINIDFTKDMLMHVDKEAARIGVARTALIKLWIAERLQKTAA